MRHVSFAVFLFAICATTAQASLMSYVSDLITASAPNAETTHRIRFTVAQAVPASGSITIEPENGAFTLPVGFDYTDIDFAVWNGSTYADRSLGSTPTPTDDGVAVVTGSPSSITITLSSGAGLAAGAQVEVRLGTNATYGGTGTLSPVNPSVNKSYHIDLRTFDALGNQIDLAWAMIAIVLPVTIAIPLQNDPPAISNGLPSGALAAGNSNIELTFTTDRTATCKYSTTAGTAYASMTDSFSTANGVFFYIIIGGHQNATTYNYYVRCRGIQGAINPDDYVISFTLAATPISNTSVTEAGAVTGSGPFNNGSMTLYQSTVTFIGYTSPGSAVSVLKDGMQTITSQAGQSGMFQAVVPNLERGTYTFSTFSTDNKGRKTASYTSVLSVTAGTNNVVSGILLPPSFTFEKNSVDIGEQVNISGTGVPNGAVDVVLVPKAGGATNTKQFTASTTSGGNWSLAVDGKALSAGVWTAKARISVQALQSDYGTPVSLGVGQSASPNLGNRSDINKDGKVNLIDFSIMLSFWDTDTVAADINDDGTVNLADFSILLFNWTG